MKIFTYVLLWGVIFVVAVTIKVYLGDLLDGMELPRAVKALIKSIPTGVCIGIGFWLHHKVKVYFESRQ